MNRVTLTVRVAVTLLALGAAWTGIVSERLAEHQRADLIAALRSHGLTTRRGGDLDRLQREVDPSRRALVAARALVGDTLDPEFWINGQAGDNGEDTVRRAARQLEEAQGIADLIRRDNPSSWRAQLLAGASRYLRWMLLQDQRLVDEADSWRQPIEAARTLAPQESEPLMFETLAQLELWQMMSPGKRDQTALQLRQVLLRPGGQEARLISAWLRVAPPGAELFAPLPDRWTTLLTTRVLLGQAGRWDLALEARRRELVAAAGELRSHLERAEVARRAGDVHLTRAALLGGPLPEPHADLLPLFVRTLDTLPPGPLPQASAQSLRYWLDWLLELRLYGVELVPPITARRLVGLVSPALTDLEAQRARLLFLDVADLRELARRVEVETVATAPAKEQEGLALLLLQLATALESFEGTVDERLRQLLELHPPPASQRPRWQLIARPDEPLEPTWQTAGGGRYVMTLSLDRPSDTLVLPLRLRAAGSGIEVIWNHEPLGLFERFPSQPDLELALRARPGVHRLEIRSPGPGLERPLQPQLRSRF